MTRQCVGCSTVLPDQGRSPRCPRCRAERERARNLWKIRAFRGRVHEFQPTLNRLNGPHLPNRNEMDWLNWLQLDLADPVLILCEHIRAGRAPYHDDVLTFAKIALDRYDSQRAEFDRRAAQRPQIEPLWAEWRNFFEQLRGLLQ